MSILHPGAGSEVVQGKFGRILSEIEGDRVKIQIKKSNKEYNVQKKRFQPLGRLVVETSLTFI